MKKIKKGLKIQNAQVINQPQVEMIQKKFYHYTREDYIPAIINSEVIKFEKYRFSESEKPIAWVSSNPIWENTATKCYSLPNGKLKSLTFDEQVEISGCARIQIKPTFKLHNWSTISKLANMRKEHAKALEVAGKKMGGNPNEWFGSLVPIPIDEWLRIEIYQDGKWIEIINFENGVISDLKSRFFIIPTNTNN